MWGFPLIRPPIPYRPDEAGTSAEERGLSISHHIHPSYAREIQWEIKLGLQVLFESRIFLDGSRGNNLFPRRCVSLENPIINNPLIHWLCPQ